ncbi:MAG: hypothetical protein AABW67_05760 [Nanoarchaeota archaeon]
MKKKTKNKLGQAHIEIMLSFVIFIGFLLFVLIFLNPFAKTESVDLISSIEKSILNNVSADIGKMSVIGANGTNDYTIPSPYNNVHFIEKTDTTSPTQKCTLYFSDEVFTADTKSCRFNTLTPQFGIYSTEKMIVYEKIVQLQKDYASNYAELKNSLGIINDFSFNVESLDGVEIPGLNTARNIPSGIEVQARNIPIRTINNQGNVQELMLNIRVW